MNIFLYNKGLRCKDNTTLIHQIKEAKDVIPIFVFTEQVNRKKNEYFSDNSCEFMVESLHELSAEIKKYNGKLYFFHNNDLIKVLKEINKNNKINSLGTNFDYSPYAVKRQELLKDFCDSNEITFYMKEDHVLFNILNKQTCKENGEPYSVFTPFRNHVLKNLKVPEVDKFIFKNKDYFVKNKELESNKYYIDEKEIDNFYEYNENANIRGGRKNGLKILKKLDQFKDYSEQRDLLSYKTTFLAAHNHFGTVSIREVYYAMKDKLKSKSDGLINELCWRDFYYNLFYNNPHMLKGQISKHKNMSFKEKFDHIKWSYNKTLFNKWADGTLGIPICDAGMRQMNKTGFMHNRLRMVTAAVLTKLLMCPWQWGEKYFAQKLKDYDCIQNGGGWGWTASGIDPTQLFRIFSPQNQSRKFDPDCEFILEYIPELKDVKIEDIHNWENKYTEYKNIYYKPAIDYSEARKETLKEMYRIAKL